MRHGVHPLAARLKFIYERTPIATRRRLKNLYSAPYLLRNGAEISTQNRRHEIFALRDKICAPLCDGEARTHPLRAIKFKIFATIQERRMIKFKLRRTDT
ncbi:hypothetical protein [uncultured Campylobacter sp.]|uniref:hypothetical protein n=1 Tax=uncultured Campylobacter sp. TaxID=218934 RepID=UPI00262219B5|nr:hypothetical protein [uncultured Campylobacter sp.]